MSDKVRTGGTSLFWTILVVLLILTTESASWLAIQLANPYLDAPIRRTAEIFREQSASIRGLIESDTEGGQTVLDPLLGFRNRAGFQSDTDNINAQGLRSLREYSGRPPQDTIRVAAFGDSFVYCGEVGDRDSWPALIEQDDPGMEVLNYGVGAYGTAQAYLRFKAEGDILSPDVIVIGFSPVMLTRTVSVYRRFLAPGDSPLVKPRFILDMDDELALIPSPVRDAADYEKYIEEPSSITELGRHDHWYRPSIYRNPAYDVSSTVRLFISLMVKVDSRYLDPDRMTRGGVFNESSEAFLVQDKLIETFFEEAQSIADQVLIVIFPARSDILRAATGDRTAYEPLADHLEAQGLQYVDLLQAFVAEGATAEIDSLFMPGNHYSPAANRIVADWLGREIRQRFSTTRIP